VGANIGFFTIFAKLRTPDLILHAFEPLPETFAVLAKNVTLHNLQHVHLHNCAVGATDGSQRTLTYYPHAPGNSTAHPKTKVELKQLLSELLGQEQADYLFSAPQEHTVRTCSISAVIERLDIPQIDLLKIDTESDELEVLRGIADWHFPHIRQIALEAHSEGERAEIEKLLANNGFGLFSEAGIAAGNTVRAIRR
jgi:FkbM family methyltransferase